MFIQTLAMAKGSITLEQRRHDSSVCPARFHFNSLSIAGLTQEGPTFIIWWQTYRLKGFLHLKDVASSNKFPVLRGVKRSKGCLNTLSLQWHAADLARHKPFGNTNKQHSFMTPRALEGRDSPSLLSGCLGTLLCTGSKLSRGEQANSIQPMF